MKKKVVLAIDLGTTGNRVIAFSKDGDILAKSYYEFPQIFPKPGWVEHNPMDIWNTTRKALLDVVGSVGAENIEAIGITNQRETTILWDKKTGKPIYNAIVWQCRRTAPMCEALQEHAELIKQKTGLFLDPYFSATKIKWILENVKGAREKAASGDLAFGTVDTWILWNLTGGKMHATEPSNASRTLCYNIHTLKFDEELLRIFEIPSAILPEVKESGAVFGHTTKGLFGREVPISGILGDQQAAFFAHGGWQEGIIKNTYGTGLFVVTSTGDRVPNSGKLVNTIAWKIAGKTTYALEGSVFIGGAAIQWLRDGLGILKSAAESEPLATSVPDTGGVYFVPALAGLGAPYWDPSARGTLLGITRGTGPAHIVRAALEALAYQTKDVIEEMQRVVSGQPFKKLAVDGGAAKNNFLMQFQADILPMQVERPVVTETTAFGAAGLAGMTIGFWTQEEFLEVRKIERRFDPVMDNRTREAFYHKWKEAVQRALNWAN